MRLPEFSPYLLSEPRRLEYNDLPGKKYRLYRRPHTFRPIVEKDHGYH